MLCRGRWSVLHGGCSSWTQASCSVFINLGITVFPNSSVSEGGLVIRGAALEISHYRSFSLCISKILQAQRYIFLIFIPCFVLFISDTATCKNWLYFKILHLTERTNIRRSAGYNLYWNGFKTVALAGKSNRRLMSLLLLYQGGKESDKRSSPVRCLHMKDI